MVEKYLERLLFDKEIVYEKSFFDSLKSSSLLEFRKNINMVQEIIPTLYLEEKVENKMM